MDGELLSEKSSFNTAALTGESIPRVILEREDVLAGMIVTDHLIRVKVIRPFGQSALSRILELVENSIEKKAHAEQLICRFARVYTPIVVLLVALIIVVPWLYSLVTKGFIYDASDWVYRGLVFLVISCPCALVISIPLGYFGGIGAASKKGILFKGINYLDVITTINTIVMDKTETLTKGVFDVQSIIPEGGFTSKELLQIVASVETQSNHPLVKAVVGFSVGKGVEFLAIKNVKEIAGHGLEAGVNRKHILVGNAKLLTAYKVTYPEEVKNIPETIVLCAIDGVYAGYIMVADESREDGLRTIMELKRMGVRNLVMLSGDKQAIVSKLTQELGVDEGYGDLLPEDKAEHMEQLKGNPSNKIALVGDGINDVSVVALRDVGLATGSMGSDVAIETADIILQTDQPSRIATAINIGRSTRRIVKENIVLALVVKFVVLALGALGMATLWEAVFADVGVSLLAILNAIRIFRMKFQ